MNKVNEIERITHILSRLLFDKQKKTLVILRPRTYLLDPDR